jgi:hypothetical protein
LIRNLKPEDGATNTEASVEVRIDRKVRDPEVAAHLSWKYGERSFKVVSLRAHDSDFLDAEMRGIGSSFVALDLDFKALWTAEEAERVRGLVDADPSSLQLERVLDNYEKTYGEFVRLAKEILDVLPAEPLIFRSSWSHGVHAYLFLDGDYPSIEITDRVRGLLKTRGVLDSPILDHRLHPHRTHGLRLPLGLGSALLDPKTLRPMFAGNTATDQVGPALKWLREHESRLARLPLDAFGSVKDAVSEKATTRFDVARALKVWKEGVLSPGTRRRRTTKVILLGRHLGFHGDELRAFVDRWIERRHNGQSKDVNAALRQGDAKLSAIGTENAGLIASLSANYFRKHDALERPPIRLGWLRVIVDRVRDLHLAPDHCLKLIEFAFDMHALAEVLTSLRGERTVPVSKVLWRSLHTRYAEFRRTCHSLGFVLRRSEPRFDFSRPGTGTAVTWSFPLLDLPLGPDEQERVALHEGLMRLLRADEMRELFSFHGVRRIRREAATESKCARWGSGELAEHAAYLALRKLRRQGRPSAKSE